MTDDRCRIRDGRAAGERARESGAAVKSRCCAVDVAGQGDGSNWGQHERPGPAGASSRGGWSSSYDREGDVAGGDGRRPSLVFPLSSRPCTTIPRSRP